MKIGTRWKTITILVDIETGETIPTKKGYYKVKTIKKVWKKEHKTWTQMIMEYHLLMRKFPEQKALNL